MPLGAVVLGPTPVDNTPLLLALLAGGMYWRGGSGFRRACDAGLVSAARRRRARVRAAAFALALLVLVAALQEPMDSLADRWLWIHMIQHILLLAIAAPLVVIASPWARLWRALPLATRRRLARPLVRTAGVPPLRALGRPAPAWLAYTVALVAWHLPAAYGLTLRDQAVHDLEHATFLLAGVLVWRQIAGARAPGLRAAFAIAAMGSGWALAIAMAFASTPWYAHYARLGRAAGSLSALTDQHLAAGVMWVPGSLPFAVAVFMLLYRWLSDAQPEHRPAAPARVRPTGPQRPRGGAHPATRSARRAAAALIHDREEIDA